MARRSGLTADLETITALCGFFSSGEKQSMNATEKDRDILARTLWGGR
ncbi:hypothetical protein HU733_02800 [Pseudomonas paralactis]|nr:hypothetical protein [Pseudomonas paralactis]MBC3254410.1 hypothetical protein [Pseudomonas paralactis]